MNFLIAIAALLAIFQAATANEPYMGSQMIELDQHLAICNIPCGYCLKKTFFKVCPFMCQRCAARERDALDRAIKKEKTNLQKSEAKSLENSPEKQESLEKSSEKSIEILSEKPKIITKNEPSEPELHSTIIINSLGEEIAVVNKGDTGRANPENTAESKRLSNLIEALGGKERLIEKSVEIDEETTVLVVPQTTDFPIWTTEIPENSETSDGAKEEESAEIINVLTVSKAQEQQKILDEYANKKFTNCCSYRGLRSCAASGVCRYNTTMAILRNAASFGCNVASDIIAIMACASSGNDNTKCCEEMGVDSIDGQPTPQCLDMCKRDGPSQVKFSHSVCVPSYEDVFKCHKQGIMERTAVFEVETTPGPKQSVSGGGTDEKRIRDGEENDDNKSTNKSVVNKKQTSNKNKVDDKKVSKSTLKNPRRRRPLKSAAKAAAAKTTELDSNVPKVVEKPKPLDPYTLQAIAIPLRLFLGGLP